MARNKKDHHQDSLPLQALRELYDMVMQHEGVAKMDVYSHVANWLGISPATVRTWRDIPTRHRRAIATYGVETLQLDSEWFDRIYPHQTAEVRQLKERLFAPKPITYLPTLPAQLYGRDDEINTLLRDLQEHHIVKLVGSHGSGVYSLANAVGHKAAHAEARPVAYRTVISATFEHYSFFAWGRANNAAYQHGLEDFFEHIAIAMEIQLGNSPTYMQMLLDQMKRKSPVLLIIHGLSQHNEAHRHVINNLPLLPNFIHLLFALHEDLPINRGVVRHITKLSMEHIDLILSEDTLQALTPTQKREIHELVDGLPLVAERIRYRRSEGETIEAIIQGFSEHRDQLMEYCFEDTYKRLSEAERDLTYCLAFFASQPGARIRALAAITGYPIADVLHLLKTLGDQALLNSQEFTDAEGDSTYYSLRPLHAMYILSRHSINAETVAHLRSAWIKWYLAFTEQHGAEAWNNWGVTYERLGREWNNLQLVLRWCVEHDEYDAYRLFWTRNRLQYFANLSGLWKQRLAAYDWLRERAEQRGDQDTFAVVCSEAAWTYALMGEYASAQRLFERAMPHIEAMSRQFDQCELLSNRAVAEYRWSKIADKEAHLAAAEDCFQRVELRLAALSGREWMLQRGNLDFYRAQVAIERGDYRAAERLANEMLRYASVGTANEPWERGVIYAKSALAEALTARCAVEGDTSQATEAIRLLGEVIDVAFVNKEWRRLAFSRLILADAHRLLGETELARSFAEKAKRGFSRLAMTQEIAEAEALLRRIARA